MKKWSFVALLHVGASILVFAGIAAAAKPVGPKIKLDGGDTSAPIGGFEPLHQVGPRPSFPLAAAGFTARRRPHCT